MLDLLTERIEVSQGRHEEKEGLKGHEASDFGSMLGQGKVMIRGVGGGDATEARVAWSIAIYVFWCKEAWIC